MARRAYEFLDDQAKTVGLIDMLGRQDTLVAYFWMCGPERERPYPMCTSLLGTFEIPAVDLEQRIALAVIDRSPVARQFAFARKRGWRNLTSIDASAMTFPMTIAGPVPMAANGRRSMSGRRLGARFATSGAGESGETADPGEDAHGASAL